MKLIALALLILPVIGYGQTKQDYEYVMGRFAQFYNSNQIDSICTLFPSESASGAECFWKRISNEDFTKENGKIKSFKYLGQDKTDPANVTVFKVVYSNTTKAMSFTLNDHNEFNTFRFMTTSEEIEKMLKMAK